MKDKGFVQKRNMEDMANPLHDKMFVKKFKRANNYLNEIKEKEMLKADNAKIAKFDRNITDIEK